MYSKIIFTLSFLFIFSSAASLPCHAEAITGFDLIHAQGCKGCHTINNVGGVSGPSLDGVGNRLTREQIQQKLLKAEHNQHHSLMPSAKHLTKQEIKLLTDYLDGLR
jgi:mono/diheme cytochrome c family protein